MKKKWILKVVQITSKVVFSMAVLFAISPCKGNLYEPILPEKLLR